MRRWTLVLLAALGTTSTLAYAEPGAPRIGVQLWSVKDEIKQDFEGTLTNSTPWDVLATNTPKEVILQQDVGWTIFAGKDPDG
jgi:hypothetical protein